MIVRRKLKEPLCLATEHSGERLVRARVVTGAATEDALEKRSAI